MRGLGIAVVLTVTVGCGPVQRAYWVRDNTSQTEYQRDLYECKRESAMVPRVPYPAAPKQVEGPPSFERGWQQGQSDAAYAAGVAAARGSEQRAQEIYNLCLQSRGYRLEWR